MLTDRSESCDAFMPSRFLYPLLFGCLLRFFCCVFPLFLFLFLSLSLSLSPALSSPSLYLSVALSLSPPSPPLPRSLCRIV